MFHVKQSKRRNKFSAKPQVIDGIKFASMGEANRYQVLKLMERGKLITNLKPHPRFDLMVNGIKIGHFTGDSEYDENGRHIIEDFKGPTKTAAYGLRIRLFQVLYPDLVLRENSAALGSVDVKPPKNPNSTRRSKSHTDVTAS